MVRLLRLIAIPAVLAISLTTVTQRTALADQPSMQNISVDVTFEARNLTAACGFTVMREDVIDATIFTYADGTQKVLWTGPSYAIVTGPGASIAAQVHGFLEFVNNPDGTQTIIEVGDNYLATAPSSGVVRGSAGRMVMVIDQDGNVIAQTFTGTSNYSDLVAECAYLAG